MSGGGEGLGVGAGGGVDFVEGACCCCCCYWGGWDFWGGGWERGVVGVMISGLDFGTVSGFGIKMRRIGVWLGELAHEFIQGNL